MSFKKLSEVIQTALINAGYENLTPFQVKAISSIKAGKDFIGIGPSTLGKSTSIAIGVLQRLGDATEDDAPRAVIIVPDKVRTLEIEAEFLRLGKRTELRVVIAHDKGHKVQQRVALYIGSDIVIGTAKRLFEMYLQNGLNLANVQMVIVDNAEEVLKNGHQTHIMRLKESMKKCQFIMMNNLLTPRIEKASDLIMFQPSLIKED